MKKNPAMYRQGDVLLVDVETIPADATRLPRDSERGVVLAEGEATGHYHGIAHRSASLYRSETDVRFMRATAGVQLGHQEHKTRCHECETWTIATHYDSAAKWPRDQAHEPRRYACASHAAPTALRLDAPGNTYIPSGKRERVIDADYVPGELPRNVAD